VAGPPGGDVCLRPDPQLGLKLVRGGLRSLPRDAALFLLFSMPMVAAGKAFLLPLVSSFKVNFFLSVGVKSKPSLAHSSACSLAPPPLLFWVSSRA